MIWSTIDSTADTVCTVRQKQTAPTTTFLCVERGRDSWQDKKDRGWGTTAIPARYPAHRPSSGVA